MSVSSLFQEIHCVRQFLRTPVPRSFILDILDDAVWAPNHRLREPWRFIYADGDKKKQLADSVTSVHHAQLAATMNEAQGVLIVTAKTNKDAHIASDDFAAVCCLIHNVQLLAWAKGLGVHWDLADYMDCPQLYTLAGIHTEEERIAGLLPLGFRHPEQSVKTERSLTRSKIEIW